MVVSMPAMRRAIGTCLRSKEQLNGVAEARHRDDDSQAVQVGWSKHCIALQECESENDGWQVLVEVGLSLYIREHDSREPSAPHTCVLC